MLAALSTERDGHILRALSPSNRISALCGQGSAAEGFAWVGGQTPHGPATGRLVRSLGDLPSETQRRMPADMVISDIPGERARAQTWRAMQNVELTLAALGSSLDRLVHLRVFLREMRNLAAVIGVLEHARENRLPTTTIIGALDCGADEEIAVAMDAVATTADSGISPEHVILTHGLDHFTEQWQNQGTNWGFTLGPVVGIQFGSFFIEYRYWHESNGTKAFGHNQGPNPGYNASMIGFGWKF